MTKERYKVLFSGKLAEGQKIEEVKKRLAALFKSQAEKVDVLFTQQLSIIKQNIDFKTAQMYIRVFGEAGAVCRIEPMEAAKSAPEPAAPPLEEVNKQQDRGGVSIKLSDAQPEFSPLVSTKITGTPDGINFNKAGIPEIPFEQITAVAVISKTDGQEEKNNLLLFTAASKRPFICEAKGILYTDFPIETEANPMVTLRSFLAFLLDLNPSIILEESTIDFLAGKPPKRLDQNGVVKLATGLAKLLQKA